MEELSSHELAQNHGETLLDLDRVYHRDLEKVLLKTMQELFSEARDIDTIHQLSELFLTYSNGEFAQTVKAILTNVTVPRPSFRKELDRLYSDYSLQKTAIQTWEKERQSAAHRAVIDAVKGKISHSITGIVSFLAEHHPNEALRARYDSIAESSQLREYARFLDEVVVNYKAPAITFDRPEEYKNLPLPDEIKCIDKLLELFEKLTTDKFRHGWQNVFEKLAIQAINQFEENIIVIRKFFPHYEQASRREMYLNKERATIVRKMADFIRRFGGVPISDDQNLSDFTIRMPRISHHVSVLNAHIYESFDYCDILAAMEVRIQNHRAGPWHKRIIILRRYFERLKHRCNRKDDKIAQSLAEKAPRFPVDIFANLLHSTPDLVNDEAVQDVLDMPYFRPAYLAYFIQILKVQKKPLYGCNNHITSCQEMDEIFHFSEYESELRSIISSYLECLYIQAPSEALMHFPPMVHILRKIFPDADIQKAVKDMVLKTPAIMFELRNDMLAYLGQLSGNDSIENCESQGGQKKSRPGKNKNSSRRRYKNFLILKS